MWSPVARRFRDGVQRDYKAALIYPEDPGDEGGRVESGDASPDNPHPCATWSPGGLMRRPKIRRRDRAARRRPVRTTHRIAATAASRADPLPGRGAARRQPTPDARCVLGRSRTTGRIP
jgi:hypothetical protein